MGAAKDDGVDSRVETHDLIDALLHEIVGTRGVGLVVFHKGHPEGTSDARDLNIGVKFLYLKSIALALNGSLGSKDAHMSRGGEITNDLSRRTDDTQHTTVGVDLGEIVLLDSAQRLSRSGVTTKDDEVAPHLKELQHSLARELIDHLETAR